MCNVFIIAVAFFGILLSAIFEKAIFDIYSQLLRRLLLFRSSNKIIFFNIALYYSHSVV